MESKVSGRCKVVICCANTVMCLAQSNYSAILDNTQSLQQQDSQFMHFWKM